MKPYWLLVGQRQQMKRLVLLSLITLTFTGCSDRTRVQCERTKNKALTSTATNQIGGGRCG